MRPLLAIAAALLVATGCQRRISNPDPRIVRISLDPVAKSWSSTGPTSTKGYHWPYATGGIEKQQAGEWPGLAYDRGMVKPYDVTIRFFDAESGAVRVEMTFLESRSPDLDFIHFDNFSNVEQVASDPPYSSWSKDESGYRFAVPEVPTKIRFLARVR